MQPIDFRDINFDQLKERLAGKRRQVYQAMLDHGKPATTRQIATFSGVDLLTVRPRVTELVELGFVVCTGGQGGQGEYKAIGTLEAMHKFQDRVRQANDPQMEMVL